ncbi:hypothetical protein SAMN05880593_14123 [Rhizobium sp. RU36D]|nr:hypothetical protein SAMN05880593_14123 [Rhizobium sp. RU36D]
MVFAQRITVAERLEALKGQRAFNRHSIEVEQALQAAET